MTEQRNGIISAFRPTCRRRVPDSTTSPWRIFHLQEPELNKTDLVHIRAVADDVFYQDGIGLGGMFDQVETAAALRQARKDQQEPVRHAGYDDGPRRRPGDVLRMNEPAVSPRFMGKEKRVAADPDTIVAVGSGKSTVKYHLRFFTQAMVQAPSHFFADAFVRQRRGKRDTGRVHHSEWVAGEELLKDRLFPLDIHPADKKL